MQKTTKVVTEEVKDKVVMQIVSMAEKEKLTIFNLKEVMELAIEHMEKNAILEDGA